MRTAHVGSSSSQVLIIEREPQQAPVRQSLSFPLQPAKPAEPSLSSQLEPLLEKVLELDPGADVDLARLSRYTQLYVQAKKDKSPQAEQLCSNLSIALALLILDRIEPAIDEEDGRQDTLAAVEEKLKEVLGGLVHPQDVETFLDEITDSDNKRKLLETLQQLEQFFRDELQNVFASANQSNQRIIAKFNQLKEALLALNANRQQMADSVHERIDRLTEEVEQALKAFQSQLGDMEHLADQMEEAETRQMALAANLEDTLNKV